MASNSSGAPVSSTDTTVPSFWVLRKLRPVITPTETYFESEMEYLSRDKKSLDLNESLFVKAYNPTDTEDAVYSVPRNVDTFQKIQQRRQDIHDASADDASLLQRAKGIFSAGVLRAIFDHSKEKADPEAAETLISKSSLPGLLISLGQ